MRNERAWPQQCWKSCVNGSNIVALCFGDHGTKEMLGVVGQQCCVRLHAALVHETRVKASSFRVDFHCRIILTCVRTYILHA